MKKIITISAIALTTILTASAADYMQVTGVYNTSTSSQVSMRRYSTDDLSSSTRDMFLWTKTYNRPLTVQQAIEKVSYICDNTITVNSVYASTTVLIGQIQDFAMLRYNAFYQHGYDAYLKELARQDALQN